MSSLKWGSRLNPPRPEVVEKVKRIRAARKGVRWSRPLGFVMLATAAAAALDPDYPMPSPILTASSAAKGGGLMPLLHEPAGVTSPMALCFRWNWPLGCTGGRLVVLDEELLEVHRQPVRCSRLVPSGQLRKLLADGARHGRSFHWLVECDVAGEQVRGAPRAFRFLD